MSQLAGCIDAYAIVVYDNAATITYVTSLWEHTGKAALMVPTSFNNLLLQIG